MAEEITPNVEGQTPEGGAPAPSGLPSDVTANEVNLEGFKLSEEFIAENFKDGKLKGRFNSVEEVLEKLKEAEDFKANTIREKTETEKQAEAAKAEEQAKLSKVEIQQNTINELLPQFIDNGMVLTPEMETTATEAGIDIRDLKLGALELKERVTAAHAVVGSAEEYNAMIQWGKDGGMTEAQMASFDKDVTGGMSEYAIKGLYSEYKQAVSEGHVPSRIEGDNVIKGIKPYANRKELFADKSYLDTTQGKRDKVAQANYKARLKATPNHILGIS